jgi:hypothetical protein
MVLGVTSKITRELEEQAIVDVEKMVSDELYYSLGKEMIGKLQAPNSTTDGHYKTFDKRIWVEDYSSFKQKKKAIAQLLEKRGLKQEEIDEVIAILNIDNLIDIRSIMYRA